LKTAHKDGVQSTGNASKGSYKGTIGIAPSNLLIENGRISFETLIAPIEIGVCIEEVQGLHAGLNAISGDFSLQCTGFLIENGQRSRPVRRITL
jgi:PmbA protein